MYKKLLLVVSFLGLLGLFSHPALAADGYTKRESKIQGFFVQVPESWTVCDDHTWGYVMSNKFACSLTETSATNIVFHGYPYTPGEFERATKDPKGFTRSFFQRNEILLSMYEVTAIPSVVQSSSKGRVLTAITITDPTDGAKVEYSLLFTKWGYFLVTYSSTSEDFALFKLQQKYVLASLTLPTTTPKIFKTTTYTMPSVGLSFQLPSVWRRIRKETATQDFTRDFNMVTLLFDSGIIVSAEPVKNFSVARTTALRKKNTSAYAAALKDDCEAKYEGATCTSTVRTEKFPKYIALSSRTKISEGDAPPSLIVDKFEILRGSTIITLQYQATAFDFNWFLGEKSLLLRSVKVK